MLNSLNPIQVQKKKQLIMYIHIMYIIYIFTIMDTTVLFATHILAKLFQKLITLGIIARKFLRTGISNH